MPRSPRQVRTALALLACLALGAAAQTDEEKARRQLEQLQRDIGQISREITADSARRNKLQEQLRQSEVLAGKLSRQISANRREITDNQSELQKLRARQSSLESSRDEQQGRVAEELRSAWQLGNQGQLAVLLNQENPHTVARTMGYYRYLYRARAQLLIRYRDTLRELEAIEQEIGTSQQQLQARQESLEQQLADLGEARKARQQTLAGLNESLADKSARLKKLEADRMELQGLLAAIEQAVEKLELPDSYQDFYSARGKMPWPVTGKQKNHYGRPRNEGKMRWQGLVIEAEEGSTVRAIHHGRVVYADWLRGYGLLLIIEHGDGYMSLYAHNQSLLRDVGEWVTAGSPISTVGNSGGQTRAALYFEIRQDGKPTDPGNWCAG